jgi:hypothetical protein
MKSLSQDILDFLSKSTTTNFLIAANEFINVLENKELSKDKFIKSAHQALISLYSAAYNLEEIELKYSSSETLYNDDEIFENKNANLIEQLAEEAFYWEVFDPTYYEINGEPISGWKITDKESSQGWLVDDFSEIYRDLKIELHKIYLLKTNESVEDGLWQLKFGFYNHWGNHAINALRYLHYFWYTDKTKKNYS